LKSSICKSKKFESDSPTENGRIAAIILDDLGHLALALFANVATIGLALHDIPLPK
jgi:hypothetical protein